MRKSEVFENFIKIAQERRLIPTVEVPKVDDSTRESISDFKPRTDAEERRRAEEVAKLYNVKNEMLDGQDYDYNIVEVAHPSPVVISDSYDKLNGLVENLNERSSIMQMIVRKTPNGRINNPKYAAEKALMLSLIRVANELDSADKDELRTLADVCIEQTTHKINKTAIAPLIYVGAIAIGGLVSSLYAKQHLPYYSDGFEQDHQKLIAEIDDLLQSNANFGVGKAYKPQFLQMVGVLKKDIMDFSNIVKLVIPMLDELDKPKTAKEMIAQSATQHSVEVDKACKALRSGADDLFIKLRKVQENFSSSEYKNRQIQEKGIVDSLLEKSHLLGGNTALVGDDMNDVKNALSTYMDDVNGIIKVLTDADAMGKQAEQEVQQAKVEQQQVKQNAPAPAAQQPAAQPQRTIEEIDLGAGELDKELGFE